MKKIILIGLILGLILFLAFIEISSWGKIYPGVKVADVHLGGLTVAQAKVRLQSTIKNFSDKKITLLYKDKEWKAFPEELGINFDTNQTLSRAFKIGRSTSEIKHLLQKSKALLIGYNFPLVVRLDENLFNQFIKENLASCELPAKNAGLKISPEAKPRQSGGLASGNTYTIRLISSEEGLEVNRTLLKLELKEYIRWFGKNPIKIKFIKDWPQVENSGIANARMEAYQIINTPLKLSFNDPEAKLQSAWKVPQEEIAEWIEFVKDADESDFGGSRGYQTYKSYWPYKTYPSYETYSTYPLNPPSSAESAVLAISLDQNKIKDFITPFTSEINEEPINAQFSIKNDTVVAFALSRDGRRLEIEESAKKIADTFLLTDFSQDPTKVGMNSTSTSFSLQPRASSIELVVSTLTPQVTTESIDNLGITTLIGQGNSNFAGSPKNRVHNIKLGAAKLNGILIKPGEEFSFNKTLQEVGPNEGYLPELVIKRDKIIPEFGGGICQVSTTLFRAALFSGLPITERFPHAIPVVYYWPQGMDATVYDPHPDLKFKNDTLGHILIQRKIIGTKLIFEFYGTNEVVEAKPRRTRGLASTTRSVKIKGPYVIEKKEDGSMKTILYREIYHDGEMIEKETFRSSYASPDKYPREQ